MPSKYTSLIGAYCKELGAAVPPAFERHPASRFAIIKFLADGPRLVATTWFKHEDLLYYLAMQERTAEAGSDPIAYRILDFKERVELHRVGKRLRRGTSF